MSIYSGFATRHLQQTYDQYLCDLLFVLQKRIIKFYQNAPTDEDKFWNIFSQLYHQILHLEKCKYLEPKSSMYLNEMYDFLKAKKIERKQDPQEDLKQFERSMAVKISSDIEALKLKQTQVSNLIRRSSFSFGKIKKQLDCSKLLDASSSTKNNNDKSFDNRPEEKLANPQEKRAFKQKRIFSSKGIRNAKSFHEQIPRNTEQANTVKDFANNPAEQIVRQYLQKTNKNYLRGYRKRKIKEDFGVLQATAHMSKVLARDKSSQR